MSVLLSVDEAINRILARIEVCDKEVIGLADALGRILAEDVVAKDNVPPFDNSAMDGYGVRSDDVASASADKPVPLQVVSDIKAGEYHADRVEPGHAVRIMTGAPVPPGVDAVVPVEQTDAAWGQDAHAPLDAQVSILSSVPVGAHIRRAGEDIRQGTVVLKEGTKLRAQELGVLAAVGAALVQVIRRPRVAILSTGDELIRVDEMLKPGKIRDSNSYSLAGLVEENGGTPIVLPSAADTFEAVRGLFQEAVSHHPDMIITSGGVSVGAADYIRDVVSEMGELGFWRINLRPGKPLAYGHVRNVPFFGLPGNPVSVMVTFDVLVRPALRKMGGQPDDYPLREAVLGETVRSDGRRTFVRVTLERRDGQLLAVLTGTQSSGALSSMVLADGLLILPEGLTEASEGERYPVRILRSHFLV
ncbi:MAG: gephyrin-like molybdotransferase Glp [Chloroflexota bacterium]